MEKIEKLFIQSINDEILKDYNVKLSGVDEAEKNSIFAFYSTSSKGIFINKYSKTIFNDYVTFIVTMLHENAHAINDRNGIMDVKMNHDIQVHTQAFSDAMREYYGLYTDDTKVNGDVSYTDSRNQEPLFELIKNKIKHKKVFEQLSELYFKYIFKDREESFDGGKYQDNGETYVIDDEGGIEI